MEEKKNIVCFPCETCKHAVVCTHRGSLGILADQLEEPSTVFISKDHIPDGLVDIKITCKFYDQIIPPVTTAVWPKPNCC